MGYGEYENETKGDIMWKVFPKHLQVHDIYFDMS